MRSVPSAFEAAAEAVASGEIYRILEIRFPATVGGTRYFAGCTGLGDDVTPAVLDWGALSLQPRLRSMGGFGQVEMKLSDPAMALAFPMSIKPGAQSIECFVHLYMGAETIVEFGGTLAKNTQWSSSGGVWSIQIDGFEKRYNKDLGIAYERASFPEARCTDCPDAIVPIVYGTDVRRIKACPIDLPGSGFLSAPIFLCASSLFLHAKASVLGFPSGVPITLVVGFPPNTEEFVGQFATPDDTEFIFTSRSSVYWSGTVDDVYASAGVQYYVLEGVEGEPRGYPLVFPDQDCSVEMITHWIDTGSGRAAVVKGDRTFGAGEPAWILRTLGYYNIWPTGTPVNEKAPWVFAASMLPMTSVTKVEARGEAQGNGGTQKIWALYDPAYYLVTLDNREFNAGIGRTPSDPGLTTITIYNSPAAAGFSDPLVYVTGNGIGGITHPVRIIEHLVTNEFLGGLPSSKVNADALDAAEAALDAAALVYQEAQEDEDLEVSPVGMQFAITKPSKLWDVVADLAWQSGGMLAFFDMGKLVLRHYPEGTPAVEDVALTFESYMFRPGMLNVGQVDSREAHNSLLVKWRADQQGPEGAMVRRAPEAVEAFGKNELALQAWAYQDRNQVARVATYMLKKSMEQSRTIGLGVYHIGALLQPADPVAVSAFIAGGYSLFNRGRVRGIARTAISSADKSLESYRVEVEVALHTWTVQATEVEACDRIPGLTADQFRNDVLTPAGPGLPLPTSSSSSSSSATSSDPSSSSSSSATTSSSSSEPASSSSEESVICQPCTSGGAGAAYWTIQEILEDPSNCIHVYVTNLPLALTCANPMPGMSSGGGQVTFWIGADAGCALTPGLGDFTFTYSAVWSVKQVSENEWQASISFRFRSNANPTGSQSHTYLAGTALSSSCTGPFEIDYKIYNSGAVRTYGTGILQFDGPPPPPSSDPPSSDPPSSEPPSSDPPPSSEPPPSSDPPSSEPPPPTSYPPGTTSTSTSTSTSSSSSSSSSSEV